MHHPFKARHLAIIRRRNFIRHHPYYNQRWAQNNWRNNGYWAQNNEYRHYGDDDQGNEGYNNNGYLGSYYGPGNWGNSGGYYGPGSWNGHDDHDGD